MKTHDKMYNIVECTWIVMGISSVPDYTYSIIIIWTLFQSFGLVTAVCVSEINQTIT